VEGAVTLTSELEREVVEIMSGKYPSGGDEKSMDEANDNQTEKEDISEYEIDWQNNEDEVIRLNPEADMKEIVSHAYSLFNKFGFGDGDMLHREDKWIVEVYARRLAEALGTIDGEIEETPCFYKEKRSLYISDLMVLDDFRNKGVATTLTKACLDFAKNNNVKLITSRIYQFNQESQSLIKKLGFEPDFTHYSYKAK